MCSSDLWKNGSLAGNFAWMFHQMPRHLDDSTAEDTLSIAYAVNRDVHTDDYHQGLIDIAAPLRQDSCRLRC